MQVNDYQNKAMRPKNDLNSSFNFSDLEQLNGSLGSISWLKAGPHQEEWGEVSLADSMNPINRRSSMKKAKIWTAAEGSRASCLDEMLDDSIIEDSISNLFLSSSQRLLLADICNNSNNFSAASFSATDFLRDITESQEEVEVDAMVKPKANENSTVDRSGPSDVTPTGRKNILKEH